MKKAGLGIAVLVALLLAASAIDKLSGSAHALEMTASFGIPPATYRLLGAIELASAALFVIPRTAVVGTLLLAAYLGGAIATHLQHQQGIAFPVALEAAVWLAAALRLPELTKRLGPTIGSVSPER